MMQRRFVGKRCAMRPVTMRTLPQIYVTESVYSNLSIPLKRIIFIERSGTNSPMDHLFYYAPSCTTTGWRGLARVKTSSNRPQISKYKKCWTVRTASGLLSAVAFTFHL
jgi:hypothetical protein